jgi:hypothetical protein
MNTWSQSAQLVLLRNDHSPAIWRPQRGPDINVTYLLLPIGNTKRCAAPQFTMMLALQERDLVAVFGHELFDIDCLAMGLLQVSLLCFSYGEYPPYHLDPHLRHKELSECAMQADCHKDPQRQWMLTVRPKLTLVVCEAFGFKVASFVLLRQRRLRHCRTRLMWH